nr:sugar kinase [Subtercola boreus]
MARVLTIGEGLGIVRARGIGTLDTVSDMVLSTGGAEVNVAIGLARLGTAVTWIGRVGNDAVGRRVVRELRAEGVDVIAPIDPAGATGVLLKSTPAPGRTDVVNLRVGSAGSRLEMADLDAVNIRDYGVLHVTGITPALSRSAAAAVTELMARARRADVLVSVDVNHRSRLWSDSAEAVTSHLALTAGADILFAGDDEARLLVGGTGTPEELAAALQLRGPSQVVIKLGALGAIALENGVVRRCAAQPVEVVDTVGAGDAFVAGYLAEVLRGEAVQQRLRVATIAGAAACSNPGDWEGAPSWAELERVHADPVNR